jgi:hypothetical protein
VSKTKTATVEREVIVNRAKKLRAEIEQTFLDADHWNRTHADQPPIEADPDGQLRQIASGLDSFLAFESEKAKP